MAQEQFVKGSIFVDNVLIADAQQIRLQVVSNDNPVRTIEKGRAGVVPGPKETKASIQGAVAASGLEFDFVKACLDSRFVELVYFVGTQKLVSEGSIMNVSFTSATDKAAEFDAEFEGGAPTLSGILPF